MSEQYRQTQPLMSPQQLLVAVVAVQAVEEGRLFVVEAVLVAVVVAGADAVPGKEGAAVAGKVVFVQQAEANSPTAAN